MKSERKHRKIYHEHLQKFMLDMREKGFVVNQVEWRDSPEAKDCYIKFNFKDRGKEVLEEILGAII